MYYACYGARFQLYISVPRIIMQYPTSNSILIPPSIHTDAYPSSSESRLHRVTFLVDWCGRSLVPSIARRRRYHCSRWNDQGVSLKPARQWSWSFGNSRAWSASALTGCMIACSMIVDAKSYDQMRKISEDCGGRVGTPAVEVNVPSDRVQRNGEVDFITGSSVLFICNRAFEHESGCLNEMAQKWL